MLSDLEILNSVKAQVRTRTGKPRPKTRRRTRQIIDWKMPGFGARARVLTSIGWMPVEALRRNDPVKVADGSFVKVAWVDRFGLDPDFMSISPQAQPISIPAGSFGPTRPEHDLLVSPAQQVQISPNQTSGTIKPAMELAGWGRITKKPCSSFTYYLFGCAQECTVCIDGLWCVVPAKI